MLLTRPDAGVADEIDGSLPVTDAPAIDQAEALLFLVEGLLLQLDDTSRADVGAELDRLSEIAGSANASRAAAKRPRRTGGNRSSTAWARGHDLAHSSVIPQYGALVKAAVAARETHGSN